MAVKSIVAVIMVVHVAPRAPSCALFHHLARFGGPVREAALQAATNARWPDEPSRVVSRGPRYMVT
jgi:hypothetical protein